MRFNILFLVTIIAVSVILGVAGADEGLPTTHRYFSGVKVAPVPPTWSYQSRPYSPPVKAPIKTTANAPQQPVIVKSLKKVTKGRRVSLLEDSSSAPPPPPPTSPVAPTPNSTNRRRAACPWGNCDDIFYTGYQGGFGTRVTSLDQIQSSLKSAGVSAADWQNVQTAFQMGSAPYSNNWLVANQGKCSSCWAYSASTVLWNMHARLFSGEPNYVPSAQQLLDCVKTDATNGCDGGTPMDAFDYWARTNIATADAYPPRPGTGTCKPVTKAAGSLKSYGWRMSIQPCKNDPCTNQQKYEVDLIKRFTSSKYPQAIVPIAYVDASQWQGYRAGTVFDVSKCSTAIGASQHVVEIEGFRYDMQSGLYVWVIKNTWSQSFGDQGRILLPFGVNACGIANYMIEPTPPPGYQN